MLPRFCGGDTGLAANELPPDPFIRPGARLCRCSDAALEFGVGPFDCPSGDVDVSFVSVASPWPKLAIAALLAPRSELRLGLVSDTPCMAKTGEGPALRSRGRQLLGSAPSQFDPGPLELDTDVRVLPDSASVFGEFPSSLCLRKPEIVAVGHDARHTGDVVAHGGRHRLLPLPHHGRDRNSGAGFCSVSDVARFQQVRETGSHLHYRCS